MNHPLVSVITVCRNAKDDLLRTQASVMAQNCHAMEWIVVDGDSSDGTKRHLESLKQPWIRWKSEPDESIYEAMNKGIQMAKGRWLWFLNAGDVFNEETTVSQLTQVPEDTEICFGETLVEEADFKVLGTRSEVTPHNLPQDLKKHQFRKGMVVSHQGFVVRRAIAPLYNSSKYQFSSDLDWMLNILSEPRNCLRLGVLARLPRRGATMDNWRRSQWERFRILCHHFGKLQTLMIHLLITLRRLAFVFKTGHLR
ncbi:MAG: glycosyltransferase [Puniceicoccaceae bacterium]